MTSVDHLHEESRMLTVRKHNEPVTKQYLIACYLPTHSTHNTVMNNPSPRRTRRNFTTYKSAINHLIPLIVDLQFVREAQNSLHQTTVMAAIDKLSHNRIINRHSISIPNTKRWLPSVTRTNLAQLRSGWSNILNGYRARIIPGTSDSCPSILNFIILNRLNICNVGNTLRFRNRVSDCHYGL